MYRTCAAHVLQVSTDRAYLSKVTAKERSKYDLGAGLGGVAGLGGLPEDFMAAAASQGMY